MQGDTMKQTLRSFFFFSILILANIIFTNVTHAGRYELVKGKDRDVCKAYGKNLNAFHDHFPMTCERKVAPKTIGFSKPNWENVDAIKNFSEEKQQSSP